MNKPWMETARPMEFPTPLIKARLVQRYKRFLADVELGDDNVITVHCPNPGSMMGLKDPGNPVWISDSRNPKRKLRHTLELMAVESPSGGQALVGINTNLPNKLAEEAFNAGMMTSITPFHTMKREVKYGENSRIDLLLDHDRDQKTFVEVKNVHLVRSPGLHEFPDSVTSRGAKHLDELAKQVALGNRAIMLYIVQRNDGDRFALARDIDPAYAKAFDQAISNGVEAYCLMCDVLEDAITPVKLIPVDEEAVKQSARQVPVS